MAAIKIREVLLEIDHLSLKEGNQQNQIAPRKKLNRKKGGAIPPPMTMVRIVKMKSRLLCGKVERKSGNNRCLLIKDL